MDKALLAASDEDDATKEEQRIEPNWVGGKCYSWKAFTSYFHIYRPPTPPYVPFGIRRFRAFTPYGVWQVVFSHPFEIRHFYSIFGFRPIV